MLIVQIVLQSLERLLEVIPFVAVGMFIERVAPADGEPPFRSVRFNVAYTVFATLAQTVVQALIGARAIHLAATIPGAGLIALSVPPNASLWRLVAIAIPWLIIRDFFYYWFHRAQHTDWLWWEHELHHSDPNMNVTTAARHHWLETPLLTVAMTLPFAYLVQAPPAVAFVAAMVGDLLGHFIHLNARISLGRWNWLVANPQTHRVHHSFKDPHIDKNFAANFPIWDVIFGTYYAPKQDEFPSTGVRSGYVPTFTESITVPRKE